MNVRRLACVLLASVLALGQASTNPNKPFTQAEVLELLRGGVPSPRVTTLVRENGVDFTPTEDDARQLMAAGAQDALLEAIREWGPERREALQHVRAGDQAQRSGFLAKAASEYTQAWQLAPALEEVGLKAARLWSDRGEHVQSARILRRLAARGHEPVLSEAKTLLDTLQPALSMAFDQKMHQGLNAFAHQDSTTALHAFQDASSLVPSSSEPYVGMARIYALGNNYDAMTNAVLTAVRQGNVAASQLLSYTEFDKFQEDSRFRDFLNNVFGSSAVDGAIQARKAQVAQRQEEVRSLVASSQAAYRRGDFAAAMSSAEQAVAEGWSESDFLEMAAASSFMLGKFEDSRTYALRAIQAGGVATFHLRHRHYVGSPVLAAGSLKVSAVGIGFEATECSHGFTEQPFAQLGQIEVRGDGLFLHLDVQKGSHGEKKGYDFGDWFTSYERGGNYWYYPQRKQAMSALLDIISAVRNLRR